ncbi:MAG TPA: sulfotransferase [Microthrixaceae bacterium]|nr:sulfotransferase [Microthrixaceae bacterium]
MPPPLFIVGTSRSGTSWAFELCASHPDMSMGYESKVPIEGIEVYRRHSGKLNTRDDIAGLLAAIGEEIDDPTNSNVHDLLSRPDVIDRVYSAHSKSPGWPTVCEALFCALEDTSNWGNKLLRIELTPTLAENWPDARFLILTRDPRGVMASQSKKFDHGVDYSAMYWNTHAQFVLDRIGLPPDYKLPNYMVVDLVEMAKDPRPALEWAFGEVGLSLDPIDDLISRYPGDPERLDKWRTTLDPNKQRQIEEYCFNAMSTMGYEPELASGQKTLGTVRRVLALVKEHGGELLRDPGSIRRKQIGKRIMSALGRGETR